MSETRKTDVDETNRIQKLIVDTLQQNGVKPKTEIAIAFGYLYITYALRLEMDPIEYLFLILHDIMDNINSQAPQLIAGEKKKE